MRTLSALLALGGSVWALSGIAGWFLAFDSLHYVETAAEAFKFFATVTLLISGYCVWWGWVFYSFKERFPFVTQKTFGIGSLVHHILCVLYLIPMDVWGGGDDPWWIPLWIISNILIAAIVLSRCSWIEIEAEQGAAPNP